METFFKDQYAKIAWRRVAVIAFVWTVFAMQGKGFKTTFSAIGWGIGHGGVGICLLALTGAAATKKSGLKGDS